MCRASNQEMEVKYDLTPSPRAAATSTSACEANRRVVAGEAAEPDPAADVPGPPRDSDPRELFLGPKKYSLP
jgi:hypothetical protein